VVEKRLFIGDTRSGDNVDISVGTLKADPWKPSTGY
jgi:hypothetical protein